MSSETKWFRACHMRLGRKMSIESATPSHSHLLLRFRRASVSNTPATMERVKKPIVHLESIPNPIDTPIASHQLASSDFRKRTTKYAVMTHARQSNATYCI